MKFEIVKELAKLTDYSVWNKYVRLVSWNNGIPKIDIRTWNSETDMPSKGIALSEDEALELLRVLKNYFPEENTGRR